MSRNLNEIIAKYIATKHDGDVRSDAYHDCSSVVSLFCNGSMKEHSYSPFFGFNSARVAVHNDKDGGEDSIELIGIAKVSELSRNTEHHDYIIYGSSDDLVEVAGDISDEFNLYSGLGYLVFLDTEHETSYVFECEYESDGVWRFKYRGEPSDFIVFNHVIGNEDTGTDKISFRLNHVTHVAFIGEYTKV